MVQLARFERTSLPIARWQPTVMGMVKLTTTLAQAEPDSRETTPIPRDWLEEFDAADRRPLATRFRYAFIRTYKPVLDDAPFRAFDTTADYRRWCEQHLPDWLGYGRI